MWARADFEQDKRRYETELAALREGGYSDDHPLLARIRRRIDTVTRVLEGDLSGLIEEKTDDSAEPS